MIWIKMNGIIFYNNYANFKLQKRANYRTITIILKAQSSDKIRLGPIHFNNSMFKIVN